MLPQKKFEQLTVKKGNKKALIAIARKQLVISWHVLTKNEKYQEPIVNLSAKQIQQKTKYYEQKLSQLKELQEKAG